jgi:uncharacterized membrane protein YkvA (DUF1232 family)
MTEASDKRDGSDFGAAYSEQGFKDKLKRYATAAGREVVEKALQMHYAARRDATPLWARSAIYGALGYFITPLDAIMDLTPTVGYADDLGVLVLALATVSQYIDEGVRQRAAERLRYWFGDSAAVADPPLPAPAADADGDTPSRDAEPGKDPG